MSKRRAFQLTIGLTGGQEGEVFEFDIVWPYLPRLGETISFRGHEDQKYEATVDEVVHHVDERRVFVGGTPRRITG